MLKTTKLTILLLVLPLLTFSQGGTAFYEHYTGLISRKDMADSDLRITADLVRTAHTFSGFYYYQFHEEGMPVASQPIALDGRVNADGSFVLNEFGLGTSFFEGQLESTKLITGRWHNKMLKQPVDFALKATYSQASIPMKAFEYSAKQYFNRDKSQPSASYHLSVLFPSSVIEDATYHQLMTRIYKLIGYRGEIGKKENMISALESAFFKQFNNSLQNIQTDSFNTSFNWEKSIRVDVINNEKGLLCLQVDTYAKTGRRPGSKVVKYLVFDVSQNKVVHISDIIPLEQQKKLNVLLQEKIRTHYHIKAEKSLTDMGFFQDSITATHNFYIHPGGLGFYYNVYEIAPFSNGPTDLFIPWSELVGIVRSPFE